MIGVLGGVVGGSLGSRVECSRAGCRNEAEWALCWRNPKIHAEDRRKVWLACAEHRGVLREVLEARSFPLEECPVGELLPQAAPAAVPGVESDAELGVGPDAEPGEQQEIA